MVIGKRVFHHAYGAGTVLGTQALKSGSLIVQVVWDDPSLSQWPGEEPLESFWTNLEDLEYEE